MPLMSEELQVHYVKALERIDSVFRKHNIQYWLDAGTLLCAYRDGNLEYEHDIDIGVFGEDHEKIRSIYSELTSGIAWRAASSRLYHTIYMNHIPGSKMHCDCIQWYSYEDIRTCWGVNLPFVMPNNMFDEFVEIKIKKLSDTLFFAPKNTERYLEMYYGKDDWKVPMDVSEYAEYQRAAQKREVERYEINKKNDKCIKFWEKKLKRKTDYYEF